MMQSDGNSFRGDVVLDSGNRAFKDEDNILDQKKTVRNICIPKNSPQNRIIK